MEVPKKSLRKKINWKAPSQWCDFGASGKGSVPCLGEGGTREAGKARLGKETKNILGIIAQTVLLSKKFSNF